MAKVGSKLPPPSACGALCATRPHCYTDYRPHYGSDNSTLTSLHIGTTKWKYEYEAGSVVLKDLPKHVRVETRSAFVAMNGAADGEIFFILRVLTKPDVMLFSYHTGALSHMEYRVELNVAADRLNAEYVPSSGRMKFAIDAGGMLRGVPLGVHVLGVENKGNATQLNKPHGAVSHIIAW